MFKLSYTRKNYIYGEVNRVPVELRPGYSSLGFLGEACAHSEYNSGEEVQLYSIWVSPYTFDGFCEAVCGTSNIGFRSFQKTLLEQGEHNVSESAFAVGYTNVSHFSEAFQKRFGILPRVLIRSFDAK